MGMKSLGKRLARVPSLLPATNMSFAENLKSERKRLGLTQAEAAALLGVSPRAVWQWEQGEEPLQVTQEGAIARLKRAKAKK